MKQLMITLAILCPATLCVGSVMYATGGLMIGRGISPIWALIGFGIFVIIAILILLARIEIAINPNAAKDLHQPRKPVRRK